MQRSVQVATPSDRTDQLISQLEPLDDVIGLSVQRGGSIKPLGDILVINALNKGIDDVLRQVADTCRGTNYSIATSEQASLIDQQYDMLIETDIDEAIWEEIETGMRQQAHVTVNYMLLMAIGGAIATVGLVSDPGPQAVAFVAASVIAPGFEPLAAVPLGLVVRNAHTVWRGMRSALIGYGVLILAAALTFVLLRWLGVTSEQEFVINPEVESLSHPTAKEITVSFCGTLAGAIIIAAYRRSIIAGALIAMVIIQSATMIGVSVVCRRWDLALEGAERFGLDVVFVFLSCFVVFAAKQSLIHKRKPIV
ncbi:DUF389 domain-containing protein [Spirosoma arcticum]